VQFQSLQTIIVAGEACSPSVVSRFADGRRLINAYGPTETAVCATMSRALDPESDGMKNAGNVTIGSPIWNTQIFILDTCLKPVLIGSIGELYIAGNSLARGYLRQSGLTSERFIANPFGVSGSRMYRTGDLARWREDGNLEYVGRVDHQVKIRGFRIELGEIESALSQIEGVGQVSVQAREIAGEQQLVAYLVEKKYDTLTVTDALHSQVFSDLSSTQNTEKRTPMSDEVIPQVVLNLCSSANIFTSHTTRLPSVVELQTALSRTLPDFMIPKNFVVLEFLPLTPNGKIDLRALPDPEIRGGVEYRAPESVQEKLIADLYSELTGASRVGLDDSFFALGGHSLLAMRLVARLREALGVELPLSALFESPTVEGLAARFSDMSKTKRFKIIPGEGAR
jgi:nonribosomal peptide synthetase DhbF